MQLHPAQRALFGLNGNLVPPLAAGAVLTSKSGSDAVSALDATKAMSSGAETNALMRETAAPRERGVFAGRLFAEYQASSGSHIQTGHVLNSEMDDVVYDHQPRGRLAVSEYLLNQHAQRRDEIRAMVGVDLYA